MAKTLVPVSQRALMQRINRKLSTEGRAGHQLRACRGGPGLAELGAFYEVDLDKNSVVAKHVDPEAYGRELGVLQPFEKLAD